MSRINTKADAIYEAIQTCDVGDNVVIHNDDGSVWCILEVTTKEMEHGKSDNLTKGEE
jgi:hypothetical protein